MTKVNGYTLDQDRSSVKDSVVVEKDGVYKQSGDHKDVEVSQAKEYMSSSDNGTKENSISFQEKGKTFSATDSDATTSSRSSDDDNDSTKSKEKPPMVGVGEVVSIYTLLPSCNRHYLNGMLPLGFVGHDSV
jgi:hypothetical protein